MPTKHYEEVYHSIHTHTPHHAFSPCDEQG